MRKLLLILLLSLPGITAAQTQGGLPWIIDGNIGIDNNGVCTNDKICVPEPWNVGDLVVVCVSQDPDNGASLPPYGITDDCGNTYAIETYGQSINIGHGAQALQMAHTHVTTGGTCNIHIAGLSIGVSDGVGYNFGRYTNISGTLDGSISTQVVQGNLTTTTTNNTSTVNGDLAVSCSTPNEGAFSVVGLGPNMHEAASDDGQIATMQGFSNCGVAGTCSNSMYLSGGISLSALVMQTLLFKPLAFAITDTQLPDCAVGSFCSFAIHSVGGVGAISCFITAGALPPGMSPGGAGNCIMSGTVGGSVGASNITFMVSDGASTASQSLTLTIGASFNTPSLIYSEAIGNTLTYSFASPVQCGDVITLCPVQGDDTHGGSGWTQMINGSSNYFSDTLGSPVQRFMGLPGLRNGPDSCVVYGPVPASGSETLNWANNQSASSGLSYEVAQIRGVQSTLDLPVINSAIGNGTTNSLSTNVTTVVDNTFLESVSSSYNLPSGSITSPFTLLDTGSATYSNYVFGYDLVSSPSTVTNAVTFTFGAATDYNIATLIVPLRPSIPFSCPVSPAPRHRSLIE